MFSIPTQLTLLGTPYRTEWIPSRKAKAIALEDDHVNVLFPASGTPEEWEELLREFYRNRLLMTVEPLLRTWAERMRVTYRGFSVKRMHTRWGTCNITRHFIWFSLMLAEHPVRLVELIVVHELCHLLETNHNARFKYLMSLYLPDWKERDRELNHPAEG
ncbi:MAG: DUF45 domain-containing protein [Kiritimatiellae bacterium]|nr:DUF45 domain-containing protein [Kiritimatiellia bacterium]